MYKEIIEKGLSKEYIEHRSQYILESIEYLIDILKYYIHDKYNIDENNINISFQYFTPEMYCPITSENYLMFYQDPSKLDFKEVEIDITLKNIKNKFDVEMMEASIPEYIDDEHFMTYYMTVSGHLQYTYVGNSMATKSRHEYYLISRNSIDVVTG